MRRSEVPGPEVKEAVDQPVPQADFICVQGNIRPEHRGIGGGLIEAEMNFFTFRPDPSKPRRNPFFGLAIMTEEEYLALSDSGGGINPDLQNSMGFIDDKNEEGGAVEITPMAKMVLEEERKTRESVSEARLHEQPQASLDGIGDELDERIKRAD